MKVFISHSGERSRALADKMKWFVGNLIQATDPWVSTGIEKGKRWIPELATQLEAAGVGIVCLTAESLDSRWVLFEAGALAKRLDGRVCTVLLDVKSEQVLPPLDQFQHTLPDQEDVWKLVMTIARAAREAGMKIPNEADLRKPFDDYYWPELHKALEIIRRQAPPNNPPERSDRDMLAELLELGRQNVRARGMEEKTLHLVTQVFEALAGKESQTPAGPRRDLTFRDLIGTPPLRDSSPLRDGRMQTDTSAGTTLNMRSEGEDPKD